MSPERQLVILGREGVINQTLGPAIATPAEWEPIPGSLRAIARLNQAGLHVVVVSNQPGLARGELDLQTLNAIHLRMHQALAEVGGQVDATLFCPHDTHSECDCRMPRPGLHYALQARLGCDLEDVVHIAALDEELGAALAAGAQPWRVRSRRRYGDPEPAPGALPEFDSLAHAVAALLQP